MPSKPRLASSGESLDATGFNQANQPPLMARVNDLEYWMGLEPAEPALFNTGDNLELTGGLWAATGRPLPEVSGQLVEKVNWEESDSALGLLATKSVISTTTACWSILKSRDHKGYVRIYNAKRYGVEEYSTRYGIKTHRLAYLLCQREKGFDEILTSQCHVDHICRNTACCNPNHLARVNNAENNTLKLRARFIEKALIAGQVILGPTGSLWLDNLLNKAVTEDTGLTLSTNSGPYRLIKASEEPIMIYGEREPCEVFDALRKPAVSKAKRKSRARKIGDIAGQETFAIAA